MSCGSSLIRIILVCSNFLFLVVGSLITYVGVEMRKNPTDIFKIKVNSFMSLGTAAIILGVTVLILSLVGFLGAATLSPGCLLVSAISYAIPLLLCIACFIAALVISNSKKYQNEIKASFGKEFKKNMTAMHEYEEKNKCCGCKGYVEYKVKPPSCHNKGSRKLYSQDCCDDILEIYKKVMKYLWIAALIGSLVTVLLIVMTASLRRHALEG